jgi:hypothetical protein
VVITIAVIVEIGLIVLVVVTDQIVQCETVMAGHEIYTGIRSPSVSFVEITRPSEPIGKLANESTFPSPVGAHRVSVFAVPLRSSHWKIAYLVTTRTDVPRLGYKFDLRENRILMNYIEESTQAFHIV